MTDKHVAAALDAAERLRRLAHSTVERRMFGYDDDAVTGQELDEALAALGRDPREERWEAHHAAE